METAAYSWLDYLLFCLMYGFSIVIGIYYGCFGNKQSTTEYLYGGKNMGVIPVGISLVASGITGLTLLGISSEVYMHGTQISVNLFALVIVGITVYFVYLPVFYKLQLSTAYDYMLLRFDKKVKILGFFLFLLSALFGMPIVMYASALTFNEVTGFNLHYILIIMSVICIFYTTIGGLKSVIWTDALQFTATVVILLILIIYGTYSVGGLTVLWDRAKTGERLVFFNMDPDPTLRTSFWSIMVGETLTMTSIFGIHPTVLQRYLATPTLKHAKRTVLFNVVGLIIVFFVCTFFGLIIYAKYHDCDPLSANEIQKPDQILPYFVMDIAGSIPGVCGLFLAGVFSTSLTTLSTFLNTLSGLIYADCVVPFLSTQPSDITASKIMKLIAAILGVVIIGSTFVVEKLGSILDIWFSLNGIATGPIMGLLILGMFFPFANSKGALTGGTISIIVMSWIIIKAKLLMSSGEIKYYPKPLFTHGCNNFTSALNETVVLTMSLPEVSCPQEQAFSLYKITFHYYIAMGIVITVVVGLVVSWLSGFNKNRVDPDLISPFLHRFLTNWNETTSYQSVENDLANEVETFSENKVQLTEIINK